MNAEEFVNKLKLCAPREDELRLAGISDNMVSELRRSYGCHIGTSLNDGQVSDELLRLLIRFDCGDVVIGAIRLKSGTDIRARPIVVGSVEADPICYDPTSGEVAVFDHGAPDHLLWRCAQSGGEFLDALVTAACFLGKRMTQSDTTGACATASSCASLAGGDAYENFYKVLLGCDE